MPWLVQLVRYVQSCPYVGRRLLGSRFRGQSTQTHGPEAVSTAVPSPAQPPRLIVDLKFRLCRSASAHQAWQHAATPGRESPYLRRSVSARYKPRRYQSMFTRAWLVRPRRADDPRLGHLLPPSDVSQVPLTDVSIKYRVQPAPQPGPRGCHRLTIRVSRRRSVAFRGVHPDGRMTVKRS